MLTYRLLCAAPLLLAACSDPATPPAAENIATPTDAAAPHAENWIDPAPLPSPKGSETPAEPGNATIGGDGSQITLAALHDGDAEGLDGELACSFAERRGGPALLIGRADVGKAARAFAVVRNSDVRETLAGTATGGFGGLEKGLTLGGKGLTVHLTPQGRLDTGDESVAQRASLRVQRADGAERSFAGVWTCGP
jgi:hypothetical protein